MPGGFEKTPSGGAIQRVPTGPLAGNPVPAAGDAGQPTSRPTVCPLCGAPAYLCHAAHTDGLGPRLHCTAASMHNSLLDEAAS